MLSGDSSCYDLVCLPKEKCIKTIEINSQKTKLQMNKVKGNIGCR